MKLTSTLVLFFALTTTLFGQTKYKYDYGQGYSFIRNAEKNLKNGNIVRAKKYVENAKKSDYGFCGNAWAEAESRIRLIEVKILNKQSKYDKALTLLDSINGCHFGADCSTRDSLKVATLILKFGKDCVKKSFNEIKFVKYNLDEFFSRPTYWIYLDDLKYKFFFETAPSRNFDEPSTNHEQGNEAITSSHRFGELAEGQTFYKLLD